MANYEIKLDTSEIGKRLIRRILPELREFWMNMGEDLHGQELEHHYQDLARLEIQLRRFENKPLSCLMQAFEEGKFNFHPTLEWNGMVYWEDLMFFSAMNAAVKSLEKEKCKFFFDGLEGSMTYEERNKKVRH